MELAILASSVSERHRLYDLEKHRHVQDLLGMVENEEDLLQLPMAAKAKRKDMMQIDATCGLDLRTSPLCLVGSIP